MIAIAAILLHTLGHPGDGFHRWMGCVPYIPVSELQNPEQDKLDASVKFDETLSVYRIRFKYKNSKKWETVTMERRNQIDLTLKALVGRNQAKYIYTYQVDLGANSKQNLLKMRIQNFAPIRTADPSMTSLKGRLRITFDANSTGLYFKTGSAWSVMESALVVNSRKPFGIRGESEEIRMESEGLPCLVECQAEGDEREELKRKDTTRSWGQDDLPLIVGEVFKNLTPATWGVNGQTLGPGPLPPPKDLGILLGHVMDELVECQKLGWIKGEGTLGQLKTALDQIRVEIKSGKKAEAKGHGNNLLKALEDMQNKSISSEVYGLVRYNLEYALSSI